MNIPFKTGAPSKEAMAFREDALALLRKHSGHLPADQMLAMASHMVGQILALQDQRKMTGDMAMGLVIQNITAGNDEVVQGMLNTKGSA